MGKPAPRDLTEEGRSPMTDAPPQYRTLSPNGREFCSVGGVRKTFSYHVTRDGIFVQLHIAYLYTRLCAELRRGRREQSWSRQQGALTVHIVFRYKHLSNHMSPIYIQRREVRACLLRTTSPSIPTLTQEDWTYTAGWTPPPMSLLIIDRGRHHSAVL